MRRPALVVAAALFLVTAAVNLEVPLYRVYAQAAGYGTGLTALVFAAYVGGLVPVLIFFGGISDRVGRKPVLLAGLLTALLATALMIVRPSMATLMLTRALQGVAVGLSVGTGTAYLAELMEQGASRAAGYVAATTALGFGGGALITSAALLYQQTLVPLSYWGVLLLTAACTLLALGLPARQGTGGTLLRLPHFPAGTIAPGIAIAVAWAVTGLVIAVVPGQLALRQLGTWSGPALFLVNGTGALVQPLARRMDQRRAISIGFVLIPLGYALLVIGAWLGLLVLVLVGAATAGAACYGFTYLGGLAAVTQAGGARRAGAVSGYFLCAYLGFGLPSVLIGFLADRFGAVQALAAFGVVVLAASIALSVQRPRRALAEAA